MAGTPRSCLAAVLAVVALLGSPLRAAADAGSLQRGFAVADVVPRPGSTLEKIPQAGFGWVQGWVSWSRAEPAPGVFAWDTGSGNDLDNVARGAAAYGLQALVRIEDPPAWATTDGSRKPYAVDPDALAAFMRAAAAHARAGNPFGQRAIAAYEILNEPNIDDEWGRPVDAEAAAGYAALLRAAHDGAKAGDPDALVVAGGLGNVAHRPGMDDLAYLRALYAAGAAGSFDALGAHLYGGTSPPAADPITCERTICFRRAELLRQVMEEHGDATTPMWVTKVGWLGDGPTAGASDAADRADLGRYEWMRIGADDQARYLVDAFAYAEANWPWAEALFVYVLDFSTAKWCSAPDRPEPRCYPPSSDLYWFSVLDEDRAPRPAYTALAERYGQLRTSPEQQQH